MRCVCGFSQSPYTLGIRTLPNAVCKNILILILTHHFALQLYLWPFAEAVHAGVGAVMCAYNKINQTQACQNSKIINGVLKEELGFMGAL
jgi:hypothetical protein